MDANDTLGPYTQNSNRIKKKDERSEWILAQFASNCECCVMDCATLTHSFSIDKSVACMCCLLAWSQNLIVYNDDKFAYVFFSGQIESNFLTSKNGIFFTEVKMEHTH